MAFIDLFSGHARQYALARPHYPVELIAWIASQSPALEEVWDCGTGNGQAARSLARHFKHVYATDASAEQIAQAPATANVTYRVEPAERSSLPEHSMDAICVAQALHWFDFDVFFAEAARVAVPQALFAAWGASWFSVSEEFDEEFGKAILAPIHKDWAPQNQWVWDGYANVPLPFPRLATPEIQISVRWNLSELMAYVDSWSATRRCIADSGDEFFRLAFERLTPAWGDPSSRRLVTMPLVLLAGRIP